MLSINHKTSDKIIFGLVEIAIILFAYYIISTNIHKDGAFHDHYEALSRRSKILAIYLASSLTFSNYCSYKFSWFKIRQKYSGIELIAIQLFIAFISFFIANWIIMPCFDYFVPISEIINYIG